MALPRKLKHLNLFVDGDNWIGLVESFTPATLDKKWEAYRGGGMMGAAKVDMGYEDDALDISFVMGGVEENLLRKHSTQTVDGILLRFAGSYQRDDTGDVTAVEIVARGRFTNHENGEQKTGENTQYTISMVNTYYKVVVDGEDIFEIDTVNLLEIVNGEDKMEAHRAAIGL